MADNELENVLADWFDSVKSQTSNLTLLDRQDITRAGAKVFAQRLREETNAKHRSTHNDKVFGHAADHITTSRVKDKANRNFEQGAMDIGWNNHYHAMNMMRVNDGTRRMRGDHFITNLQNDQRVIDEVLTAEKRAYSKIVARKQSQNER